MKHIMQIVVRLNAVILSVVLPKAMLHSSINFMNILLILLNPTFAIFNF